MRNAATPNAVATMRPMTSRLSLVSSPMRSGGALSGEIVSAPRGEDPLAMVAERLGRRDGNLADLLLPLTRAGLVHRPSARIHGDGHRHALHLELVDRFHAEVGEGDHPGGADRLGDEIRRAADGHEVGGLVPLDRLDRRGTAFGLAD